MTLSLKVLNALLALSLIVLVTWFTNQSHQSFSLLMTCGLFLLISCCSNISISHEMGCLSQSCLSNSGCLGLSGLNLTNCGGGGEEVLWDAVGEVLGREDYSEGK